MKKIISAALAALLAFSMFAGAAFADAGLSNFKKTNTYKQGQFTDVSSDAWYAKSVAAAYELDLMNGQGAGAFGSDANVKLSEAIAMAARLHSIYNTGKADFAQSTPWYKSYVDYAVENKIISANRFDNLELYATRYQFAEIFAAALPDAALKQKNNINVGDIPDVSLDTPYEPVYKLYRAGVITGKTEAGHFNPKDNILRSEVAAIVTRMADVSLRVAFTIKKDEGSVPTGDAELAEQIRLAKASIATAIDYLGTAQSLGLATTYGAAFRMKANESAQAAAQYGKDAFEAYKDKDKYATVSKELERAYLSGIEAAKMISALTVSSPNDNWNKTATMLQGSGDAFATAGEALSKVK